MSVLLYTDRFTPATITQNVWNYSTKAEAANRLKYQIDFAQAGFRGLTLINGGAIIALFTFLGNAMDKPGRHIVKDQIWWAFGYFTTGLVMMLGAIIMAFYSQLYFYNSTEKLADYYQKRIANFEVDQNPHLADFKRGNMALYIAVACSAASLIAFILGAKSALSGVLI